MNTSIKERLIFKFNRTNAYSCETWHPIDKNLGWDVVCHEILSEYWEIPDTCKRMDVILTNQKESECYRLFFVSAWGHLYFVKHGSVLSLMWQREAIKEFIEVHGVCYIYVEVYE